LTDRVISSYAVRFQSQEAGFQRTVTAARLASIDLREYARRGAAARLEELDRERQSILAEFPELRRGNTAARERANAAHPAGHHKKARRRRRLSAEARKRISDAQKRRWAAKKRTA
jgi:hypothetical protein